MAPLKRKGDRAEIEVARDLVRRGFRIAIPYGEDWDFDLICSATRTWRARARAGQARDGEERSTPVRCCSHSLTNGRVRKTKRYTAETIDWLAAFDPVSDRCYYIPAASSATAADGITLRLDPARNNQVARASRYRPRPISRLSQRKSERVAGGGASRDRTGDLLRCKRGALPTELWPQGTDCRHSAQSGCRPGRLLGTVLRRIRIHDHRELLLVPEADDAAVFVRKDLVGLGRSPLLEQPPHRTPSHRLGAVHRPTIAGVERARGAREVQSRANRLAACEDPVLLRGDARRYTPTPTTASAGCSATRAASTARAPSRDR